MKAIITTTLLIMLCLLGDNLFGEMKKYSNGIIISKNQINKDNYKYFLNGSFVGKNKAGTEGIIEKISSLPDYSIVIINDVPLWEYAEVKFFDNDITNRALNKMVKEKSLLFVQVDKFNYSIKNVLFVYVIMTFEHSGSSGKWEIFSDGQNLGINDSGLANFFKIVNKNKFLFIVFEQRGHSNISMDKGMYSSFFRKFQEKLNKLKLSYYIQELISDNDHSAEKGSILYSNYSDRKQKAALAKEKERIEALVDENLRYLPQEFRTITMTGDFKSFPVIISVINAKLSSTPYKIINSCSQTKVIFTCEAADLTSIIKVLCIKYKLKIKTEGNNIILQNMDSNVK